MIQGKPDKLNDAQWKAVIHNGSHLLIVAGPGTGKTHTLTHRISYCSQNLEDNKEILAITFTNKAADEIKKRLNNFGDTSSNYYIGTFHSFGLKLLREFCFLTDLPADFRVVAPDENKKEGQNPATIDFDNILVLTVKLLQEKREICQKIQQRFQFVFVDEYQDINAIQFELLQLIVGKDALLTVIGDPNQAIYGFRGSDVRFFEDFEKHFAPYETRHLTENFRSTSNLLMASSQIIHKDDRFKVPELIAKIYEKGQLMIYEAPTDKAEAEYVVHQIEQMIGGTSMFSQDSGRVANHLEGTKSFGDIAVLYRLNQQGRLLDQAFDRSGIPYQMALKKKNTDAKTDEEVLRQYEQTLDANAEKVSLLSIHAAKGLEFPVVFVIGCEETLLPLNLASITSSMEEERRLFYVGMTRAKECLYLTRAKKRMIYGKTYQNNASPFLSDIEEGLKSYEQNLPEKRRRKNREKQMTLFR